MSYHISDKCLGCGACVDDCPAGAILADGDKFKIDVVACSGCGACIDLCPAQAIEEI